MFEEFTIEERRRLLDARAGALRRYESAMAAIVLVPPLSRPESEAIEQARRDLAEADSLEAQYFDCLPTPAMGCCPFDGQPLVRSFDAWGFDGPWWRPDACPPEPPACPHFFAIAGALDDAGAPVSTGGWETYAGPGAPYVIPRLLEHPSAVAVIASLRMETGAVVYITTYFAERKPKPENRTAAWPRTNFVYTTQFGVSSWRIPDEAPDFDLRPWLEAAKLRWCEPDSDNTSLSPNPPDRCPYIDLPGDRCPAVLTPSGLIRRGRPDGRPVWPMPQP